MIILISVHEEAKNNVPVAVVCGVKVKDNVY